MRNDDFNDVECINSNKDFQKIFSNILIKKLFDINVS